MARRLSRRGALRFMAAAPVGVALAGCGGVVASVDAGRPDSSVDGDSSMGDASLPDAGPAVCEPTTSDARGPFFEDGAPMRMLIADPAEPGERMLIQGVVMDADGCTRPLGGYVVDLWQADAVGNYYDAISTSYRLRGRLITGADGRFAIETIKPGFYLTPTGPRPAHLHVRVVGPEGAERLVTQLYFESDSYLGRADGCQPPTCFSNDPARIIRLEPARIGGADGLRGAIQLNVSR